MCRLYSYLFTLYFKIFINIILIVTQARSIKTYSIYHFLLFQALKSLLRYMANDWDKVTNNTERETMVNIARITRKITIGSTLMVNIVILAFVPARLSSMKNNDITLFLRGYYPYNTSISPNFELTMIGQYVAAIYAANTYTTVDTLVVLLIFHVCGQLSILRQDLEKIHSYDKKNIEMKMQKIVEKHEYINRFVLRKFVILLKILGNIYSEENKLE